MFKNLIIMTLSFITLILVCTNISSINIIDDQSDEIISLKDEISDLESDNKVLNNSYNTIKSEYCTIVEDYSELQSEAKDIETKYNGLVKTYKTVNKKYNKLKKREELYDKYGYAIKDTDGSRTDLKYSTMKLGVKLMKKKGYDPNILFAMGMVESNFRTNCTMESSGAAGFMQFIPSTGKFTYEYLMNKGKGTYNHSSTPYNQKTSIEMAVAYLDYLFKKHDNKFKAIKQYCGDSGDGSFTIQYINRMNKYAKNVNIWHALT